MTIQLCELARVRDGVEPAHPEGAPWPRDWLDAIRMHDSPAAPDKIEAMFELVASGKREHAV